MVRIFRTSRSRIRDEAADWVARLGSHSNAQNSADFRRWYEADPRNREAYDRIAAIYSGSARTSPRAPGLRDRIVFLSSGSRLGFALAASVGVAVALLAILLLAGSWLPKSAAQPGFDQQFATSIGEIGEFQLPDGSRLILDSDSRVETRFSGTERRLSLVQGRARFTVEHEARPFIVLAASSEILATGTVFDVSLVGDGIAVVLLEGSVEVRRPHPSDERTMRRRLRTGQKLLITSAAPTVQESVSHGETMWPARMLEFDNMRVEEAAAIFNRHGGVQLRLGSDRIRKLRISGAYRTGDVGGFAHSAAAAFDLRLGTLPDGSLLLAEPQAANP